MDQDKKIVQDYLPKELTNTQKNKIMKILFLNGKKIYSKNSKNKIQK